MIDAYKSGIPGNGKHFPDGSQMAKIHWNAKKSTEAPTLVPNTLHDVDFMERDSKRFPHSGGWDTRSSITTASPAPFLRRQRFRLWIRLSYDSDRERLYFHGQFGPLVRIRRELSLAVSTSTTSMPRDVNDFALANFGIGRDHRWATCAESQSKSRTHNSWET